MHQRDASAHADERPWKSCRYLRDREQPVDIEERPLASVVLWAGNDELSAFSGRAPSPRGARGLRRS